MVIAAVFTLLIWYITIHLMHDSYHTSALDLGAYAQTLKYTLQGKLLYYTTGGLSELAYHFSPVLLILVPVYWLFPYVQTLLVVQGIMLGISGFLVYVLAREYRCDARTSLIIELLFFANPLVWGVAMFDFHPVVFAIPALLVMFLGLKRQNRLMFAVGLFFALISKEDVIVALAVFGFTTMAFDYWRQREIKRTSVVILVSAVFAYAVSMVVSKLAAGDQSSRMLSFMAIRYAYLSEPISVAIPMFFKTTFSAGSLFLILGYLAPLGFVPLLSLEWSIPGLVIMLSGILSTATGQHDALMHFSAAAIPFLFMAFIVSLPKLKEDKSIQLLINKTNQRIVYYSLVLLLLASVSILSEGRIEFASLPDKHDVAINQVIEYIPDNATVSASNAIFPHICDRTDAYLLVWDGESVAKLAGIVSGKWGFPDSNTEYVIVDSKDPLSTAVLLYGKNLARDYNLIIEVDGVRLYKIIQG